MRLGNETESNEGHAGPVAIYNQSCGFGGQREAEAGLGVCGENAPCGLIRPSAPGLGMLQMRVVAPLETRRAHVLRPACILMQVGGSLRICG